MVLTMDSWGCIVLTMDLSGLKLLAVARQKCPTEASWACARSRGGSPPKLEGERVAWRHQAKHQRVR